MKEIEIKFHCQDRDLQAIAHLKSLSLAYILEKPHPFKTEDTYLGTWQGLLLQKGASLRGRERGGQFRVTFKSHPSIRDGQLTREEWEQEVSGEEFQALLESGQVPDFCASAVQGIIGEEALIPVLAVRNHRKVRPVIHKHRGIVAEMSLDYVTFLRNGKKAPYFGIEVELMDNGTEVDLKAISKDLTERFPELAPDAETKFEKGMRLLN